MFMCVYDVHQHHCTWCAQVLAVARVTLAVAV